MRSSAAASSKSAPSTLCSASTNTLKGSVSLDKIGLLILVAIQNGLLSQSNVTEARRSPSGYFIGATVCHGARQATCDVDVRVLASRYASRSSTR